MDKTKLVLNEQVKIIIAATEATKLIMDTVPGMTRAIKDISKTVDTPLKKIVKQVAAAIAGNNILYIGDKQGSLKPTDVSTSFNIGYEDSVTNPPDGGGRRRKRKSYKLKRTKKKKNKTKRRTKAKRGGFGENPYGTGQHDATGLETTVDIIVLILSLTLMLTRTTALGTEVQKITRGLWS